MKHHPITTANASAVTVAIIYITCALAVGLFPEFTMSVTRSWFHGIDLSKISSWNFSAGSLMLGLMTAVAYAWFIGYLFANIYNYFLNK